jgi:hypothetical protein
MVSFTIGIVAGIAVLALLCWCAARGLRDGDCPADARVSAVLRDSGQPDEPRPVIVATVVNPSGAAVLAGLSAGPGRLDRLPAWLDACLDALPPGAARPLTVTVPRRTARAKFRPGGYATVGIVPASGTVRFPVPVDRAARRYVLTAAIGQSAGRLRLHRLHVARESVRNTYPGRRWAAASGDCYGRPDRNR